MTTNNADRERAQRLLRHYFRMLAEASGIRWDSDMEGEVGDIADHIIAAAVAECATHSPRRGRLVDDDTQEIDR